jgi:hypothetical protein
MKRKRPNRTAEKVNRNSMGALWVYGLVRQGVLCLRKGTKRRVRKQKSRSTFFGGAGISDIYTVHTA